MKTLGRELCLVFVVETARGVLVELDFPVFFVVSLAC